MKFLLQIHNLSNRNVKLKVKFSISEQGFLLDLKSNSSEFDFIGFFVQSTFFEYLICKFSSSFDLLDLSFDQLVLKINLNLAVDF